MAYCGVEVGNRIDPCASGGSVTAPHGRHHAFPLTACRFSILVGESSRHSQGVCLLLPTGFAVPIQIFPVEAFGRFVGPRARGKETSGLGNCCPP